MFIRQPGPRYGAIIVDAYRQPYIPFYLTTRGFLPRSARTSLPGVVIVNVGHPPGSDSLEQVLTATMQTDFQYVRRDPADDVNTWLVEAAIQSAILGSLAPKRGCVPVAPARGAGLRQDRSPIVGWQRLHGRSGASGLARRPVASGLRGRSPLRAPRVLDRPPDHLDLDDPRPGHCTRLPLSGAEKGPRSRDAVRVVQKSPFGREAASALHAKEHLSDDAPPNLSRRRRLASFPR